jgi:hypothetical protein
LAGSESGGTEVNRVGNKELIDEDLFETAYQTSIAHHPVQGIGCDGSWWFVALALVWFVMRYIYRYMSSSYFLSPVLHATVHLWQGHQLHVQILNSHKATSRMSNWGCWGVQETVGCSSGTFDRQLLHLCPSYTVTSRK